MKTAKTPLLRIRAAVDYLDGAIVETTLRRWIALQKIEVVHLGRNVCIPQSALDEFIARGTVPARNQMTA